MIAGTMDPASLLTTFVSRQILSAEFLAGIVGNLVASAGYEIGRGRLATLANKLQEVWGGSGVQTNHDLLRALLFAESRAAMQVCDLCLLEHRVVRLSILKSGMLSDHDERIVAALRHEYKAWSNSVREISIDQLQLLVTS